jgi:hypothetical protein
MALRYDLTAPLARFAAQNWETLAKPFRRYAFGPVWRNEKPGPGRLREFMQCDADIVGTDRPEADAEIIAMAVTGFKALDIPVRIRINNRKLLNGLLSSLGVTEAHQQLGVLRAILRRINNWACCAPSTRWTVSASMAYACCWVPVARTTAATLPRARNCPKPPSSPSSTSYLRPITGPAVPPWWRGWPRFWPIHPKAWPVSMT